MVIKGKSIGHAAAHARHLMRTDQNDRIEFIEFDESAASPTLKSVLTEYQVIAEHLTKAQKGMYIAALNPEEGETLTPDQWKEAVDILEKQLGLDNQPRTVVLHEKKGREHVHVVWQRTDLEHERVVDDEDNYAAHERASREIEKKFDLAITKGVHTRDKATEPRPDRASKQKDHQQADRKGYDLDELKAEINQAFEEAEHGMGFIKKLEEMGCYLARGDKKNIFMIVPPEGGALKLSSTLKGISANEWKAKLSPLTPHKLQTVSEIRREIENPKHPEIKDEAKQIKESYAQKRDDLKLKQTEELKRLQAEHRIENNEVNRERKQDLPKGIFIMVEYLTGITWFKSRQHGSQDRERLAHQKQAENALIQDHRNQLRALDQEKVLALYRLDEATKPDQPPLKARFEVNRTELALNEFKHAVKAHDEYFNENIKAANDRIFKYQRQINKVENRELYLESLNQIVVGAFDKYFKDGDAAYEEFREACGLVKDEREWISTHVNKSTRARNFKTAMKALIAKPETFGDLVKENWSAEEVGKRREDMKHDIEETARRIHYMTIKVENERARFPLIQKQQELIKDKKLERVLMFDNERLAHLRLIEQKADDLSANQLKSLSSQEEQRLEFAREKMKNAKMRNRADKYLEKHNLRSRTKRRTKTREHDLDEPHL